MIIDGLAKPLYGRDELARKYQLIHYHRRGYVGSSRGTEPLTIPRQAADAAALLRHLRVERAHVAGHSYGGIIALQLALDASAQVHSLALLEPALRAGPMGRAHMERTVGPARQLFLAGDQAGFVVSFTDGVFGPGWQPVVERRLPGAMAQAIADASTFFEEQPPAPMEIRSRGSRTNQTTSALAPRQAQRTHFSRGQSGFSRVVAADRGLGCGQHPHAPD